MRENQETTEKVKSSTYTWDKPVANSDVHCCQMNFKKKQR